MHEHIHTAHTHAHAHAHKAKQPTGIFVVINLPEPSKAVHPVQPSMYSAISPILLLTHHPRCCGRCCTSPSPGGSGRLVSSSSPHHHAHLYPGTSWPQVPCCGNHQWKSCMCWRDRSVVALVWGDPRPWAHGGPWGIHESLDTLRVPERVYGGGNFSLDFEEGCILAGVE